MADTAVEFWRRVAERARAKATGEPDGTEPDLEGMQNAAWLLQLLERVEAGQRTADRLVADYEVSLGYGGRTLRIGHRMAGQVSLVSAGTVADRERAQELASLWRELTANWSERYPDQELADVNDRLEWTHD